MSTSFSPVPWSPQMTQRKFLCQLVFLNSRIFPGFGQRRRPLFPKFQQHPLSYSQEQWHNKVLFQHLAVYEALERAGLANTYEYHILSCRKEYGYGVVLEPSFLHPAQRAKFEEVVIALPERGSLAPIVSHVSKLCFLRMVCFPFLLSFYPNYPDVANRRNQARNLKP
jgi:hypothetical protein